MQATTLFKTSYNYLLFAGFLLVVFSFFDHEAMDFHYPDTYFVIANSIIYMVVAAVLVFIWCIYYLLRKVLLAKWLSWLHVVSITVCLVIIFTANFWYQPIPSTLPRRYYAYSQRFTEDEKRLLVVFIPLTILFLAGQVAFFINTIGGCIKYLINKNR